VENNFDAYFRFRERILKPFTIHGGTSLPHMHLKTGWKKLVFEKVSRFLKGF